MYDAFIVNNFMTNDDDSQSLQITLPPENLKHKYCANILDKLVPIPIDIARGISVVCEQPISNHIMLNVGWPGVLRQYFGYDLCYKSHDIITRVTHG